MHSKLGLLLIFIILCAPTKGIEKVIYGSDDRLELYEIQNENLKVLAKATAAKIRNTLLDDLGDEFMVKGPSLEIKHNLCPSEPYAEQPATADCSGFLVAPNLLVTAGHCMQQSWKGVYPDCGRYQWAFDYKADHYGQTDFKVKKENVYSCKRVVAQKLDKVTNLDYAIIELDRPVYDRKPLKFRNSGKIADDQELFVIGYPSGLPAKISANAKVRTNHNSYYFSTNLDSFEGNSGAPVFNSKSGEVEGILVRGETDFIRRSDEWCKVSYRCSDLGCKGEDVTRITSIPELKSL
jgi:hypothetical protein